MDDIKAVSVNVSDLSIAADSTKKALLKSKDITVKKMHLTNQKDVRIDSNTLIARISMNKQGNIPLLDRLMASIRNDNAELMLLVYSLVNQ